MCVPVPGTVRRWPSLVPPVSWLGRSRPAAGPAVGATPVEQDTPALRAGLLVRCRRSRCRCGHRLLPIEAVRVAAAALAPVLALGQHALACVSNLSAVSARDSARHYNHHLRTGRDTSSSTAPASAPDTVKSSPARKGRSTQKPSNPSTSETPFHIGVLRRQQDEAGAHRQRSAIGRGTRAAHHRRARQGDTTIGHRAGPGIHSLATPVRRRQLCAGRRPGRAGPAAGTGRTVPARRASRRSARAAVESLASPRHASAFRAQLEQVISPVIFDTSSSWPPQWVHAGTGTRSLGTPTT